MSPSAGREPPSIPERPARAFFRLIIGILLVYALIVGVDGRLAGAGGRLVLLAFVLYAALRGQYRGRNFKILVVVGAVVGVALPVIAAIAWSWRAFDTITAAEEAALVAGTIAAILYTLISWRTVNLGTVLGVLCVYLLAALFFADLHRLGGLWQPNYMNGVVGIPTAGDCLYLSVITLSTVGFGDVTPATEFGRTVAITEAMLGQLYLVSVVAAVVAGWRRATPPG